MKGGNPTFWSFPLPQDRAEVLHSLNFKKDQQLQYPPGTQLAWLSLFCALAAVQG